MRNYSLTNGPFRRPHAARRFTKDFAVVGCGILDLSAGILWKGERNREGCPFTIDDSIRSAIDQRKNRVVERGGGNFDLSRILEVPMDRNDIAHNLELLFHHFLDVGLIET
ncbi:MAG: hypothetical protein BGO12_20575 [Verrucomicrobia bacterium 61-8]|nr:MAG: hypothetical protein BGO12_20575 [Verrucomicrobia bacterium 61-8]